MRALLAGLVLLITATAHADRAVYVMRGPVLPGPRSVNGYAVEIRDRADGSVEVHVETSLDPIGSRGSFAGIRDDGGPAVPKNFDLPTDLRTALRPEMDAWEAATIVLEWVSVHLSLVDDDRRPQDAASVLARRGGRCSGLANATAALLMVAGFEARTVSGLLINDHRSIPHRWVECKLPGAGWVPTDPTLGLWAVTARHVAFPDAVHQVPEIVIEERARGELHRLPRSGRSILRPNQGAALVCRLRDPGDGRTAVASLVRGSDRRQAVLGPEVRFDSLLPGRWLLVVELDGRVVERRELTLKEGVVNSYVVSLPQAAPGEVGS